MIGGLKSGDYSDRLKELGLTTLEERRHQLDMVQVYKIVNGVGGVNSEQCQNVRECEGDQENGSNEYSDPSGQAGGKEKLFLPQSAGGLEQRPRRNPAGKDCPGF